MNIDGSKLKQKSILSDDVHNLSSETRSSFVSRAMFIWFDEKVWRREKTVKQLDVWDLNPSER